MEIRQGLIASFVVVMLPALEARAQSGVVVASGECSCGNGLSLTGMPECKFGNIWCERVDSDPIVVDPGTSGVSSTSGICANCPVNCDQESSSSDDCEVTLTLNVNGTTNVSISNKTSINAVVVEAELLGIVVQIGSSVGCTISTKRSSTLGPCRWKRYKLTQSILTGRKAKITHTWYAKGSVVQQTDPDYNPGGTTCDLAGQTLSEECESEDSTLTATKLCVGSFHTNVDAEGDCPAPES